LVPMRYVMLKAHIHIECVNEAMHINSDWSKTFDVNDV
jgi:hypothetical protein